MSAREGLGWDPVLAFCRRVVRESTTVDAQYFPLADLHCHTVFSDGLSTPEKMAYEASLRGLQFVAITDHLGSGEDISQVKFQHYFERCSRIAVKELAVIPGIEVASLEGDIVCLLPSFRAWDFRRIRGGRPADEAIDAIHGSGGLAIAAHPFRKKGVGERLFKLKFDGAEMGNPLSTKRAENRNLALVGSSDAHTRLGLGASYTCLHKDLSKTGQLSVSSLLEALRQKRSSARMPEKGTLLRRMDRTRWFRPDYTAKAVLRRIMLRRI